MSVKFHELFGADWRLASMRILSKVVMCLFLLTIVLTAADVSGKWKGRVINARPGGTTHQTQEIHMELSQQGKKVSGTMGPSADKQFPLDKGDLEGNRLRLLQGGHRVVELTLSEERLVGTMSHANKPGDPVARLELHRVKE